MYFMMFVVGDPTGVRDDDETLGAWLEEGKRRGIRVHGAWLHGADRARTVRFRDGEVLVSDGPFTASDEWIVGFDILSADSIDDALDYAARHPMAHSGSIEVREFWPLARRRAKARPPRGRPGSTRYFMFVATDTDPDQSPGGYSIREWVSEMTERGITIDGDRLRPAEDARTIRVRSGQTIVTDGPFTESKEWVAGYDLLQRVDLDEAIEVASKHPMARAGRLELRPVRRADSAE
jgi:hypothetical protein